MFSKSLVKHFRGFSSVFTKLHAKLVAACCSILPSIADKMKHEVEKHSCKNSACSQRGATWQTDAVGLQKCSLGLPSNLLSLREAVTAITVWELSNTTS
jgi:hypothetical protein